LNHHVQTGRLQLGKTCDELIGVVDFEAFLAAGSNNEFVKERELAKKWVNEIRTSLEASDKNAQHLHPSERLQPVTSRPASDAT